MNGTCASKVLDESLPQDTPREAQVAMPSPTNRHDRSPWPQRMAAVAILIALSPLMLVVALLVRVTSRGPVIYRQWRLGKDGRRFQLYKFRTMRVDAEAATGPVWASACDPRATPIGNVLRRLGLDELPQLVNVIRGDMAIVGPRPERPEIADVLALEIPCYFERLTVHPGITGLAQVNLPADSDIDSVRRKLQLDLEYIESRNLTLDACIVLATAPRVIGTRGQCVVKWLGLARNPHVEANHEPGGSLAGEVAEVAAEAAFRPANPR